MSIVIAFQHLEDTAISLSSDPHFCCWEVSHKSNHHSFVGDHSPCQCSQSSLSSLMFSFLWCSYTWIFSYLSSWHSLSFQKFSKFWEHLSHCLWILPLSYPSISFQSSNLAQFDFLSPLCLLLFHIFHVLSLWITF